MGGSMGMFGRFGPMQMQQQLQQFSNDDIMSRVKSGYGQEMANSYRQELLSQLRNNTYTTPYAVYQNTLQPGASSGAGIHGLPKFFRGNGESGE